MDEEQSELIKENMRLARENNKLLRKLWKAEKWGFWSKILFYLIIIGVPVLIYQYYLADLMDDLQGAYEEIRQDVDKIKDIPSQLPLGAVIESIEEKRQQFIE